MKTPIMLVGSLVLSLILFSPNLNAQTPGTKTGIFNRFSNIGSPQIPGTATYDKTAKTYRISGSGSNIWLGHDSCSFLSKKMKGDFILKTRVRFMGEGHELHRKTGIMIRKSQASNSTVVCCTVHGDGLTSLQYRSKPGEEMKEIKFTISGPDVLQLEKKGNTYIMSVSHFGKTIEVKKIENIDLGSALMAGLFICSHNSKYSEEVEFSNTKVIKSKQPLMTK